jgi:E3 ubiquitin-protein ligase HUWE1
MAMKSSQLRRAAKYEFVGEPAMDSGGVTREWFNEVSNLIFGGPFGLFVYSADAGGRYSINPNSELASELHLQYFRFAGRFLGKALFENCTVVGRLDTVLYKHLLQLPITGSDVELVDPQVWQLALELWDG